MGGVEDVEVADDVDLERRARVVDALAQPERGEQEDVVGAMHQLRDQLGVEDRALDELDAVVLERAGEAVGLAAHEVVEHDDLLHGLVDQLVDDVRADETGAAYDEYA